MFPLTSPSRATVDKQLLGFWKRPEKSGQTVGVYTLSECAKLGANLVDHPNIPRGAMFATYASLNTLPTYDGRSEIAVCWPTQIGSTSYLNTVFYDTKTKKLRTGSKSTVIFKYVVTGDSLAFYELSTAAKTRIKARLGDDYNSADLLQEISKATEWDKSITLTRIR